MEPSTKRAPQRFLTTRAKITMEFVSQILRSGVYPGSDVVPAALRITDQILAISDEEIDNFALNKERS